MKEPIYHVIMRYKNEIHECVTKDAQKYFKIRVAKSKQHIEVDKKLCEVVSRKQIGTSNI